MLRKQELVRVHVLPGGKMPKRQTEGAIGFDVCLRAIVCAHTMDPNNPTLRRTLFDFKTMPKDPKILKHVRRVNGELVYRLGRRERVLVGIGFATNMKYPMFYWVAPRSGLASKWGITVTNAPGTVDPDYRGEAGVAVFNQSRRFFDLRANMRIAQIIFQRAEIPTLQEVKSHEKLGQTSRGVGGFGSTGLK